jgi:hypothetical protein
MDPRTGLDAVEKRKILPYGDSNSDPSVVQPVANCYPGSYTSHIQIKILSVPTDTETERLLARSRSAK